MMPTSNYIALVKIFAQKKLPKLPLDIAEIKIIETLWKTENKVEADR